MIGQTISHFRVDRYVGEGGMGTVYEAQDLELERRVALKVLRREWIGEESRRARFIREAKTAASVTHPNLCTIYEVGEDEGETFIAMEFVEGRTLRELLDGGHPPLDQVLRLAAQAAAGVVAAHQAGIVHRDLKPENVMIDTAGRVRILDFGLAKPVEPPAGQDDTVAVSREGRIVGTVAYMSPEQARGLAVDARSDIFSFGITLYELVTGETPFRGPTPSDTLAAILREDPRSTVEIVPDLPPELARIVAKCLEKAPEDRYQDARDLVVDLKRLRRETETHSGSGERVPMMSGRRPSVGFVATTLIVIGVAIAAAVGFGRRGDGAGGETLANSLAVMPFQNLKDASDPERLGQILQELIITDLSSATGLKVFSSQRLFDVQKQLGSADARTFDRATASRIATRVGAQTVLEGSISQLGDRWIVTAQLVDAKAGTVVGSRRVDGTDLYAMVDRLTDELRAEPRLAAVIAEGAHGARAKTSGSLDAYRLYLAGLDLLNEERYADAADTLAAAVGADPSFGKAYYELAIARWWDSGAVEGPQSEARGPLETLLERGLYANRGERLMAEAAHALIGQEWDESVALYEQVAEFYPEEKDAWYGLGEALFHSGRMDDVRTLAAFDRAIELDPAFTLAYPHVFDLNAKLGRYDASMDRVRAFRAAKPEDAAGWRWWMQAAYLKGDPSEIEAARSGARAALAPDDYAYALVKAARACENRGAPAETREILVEAREIAPKVTEDVAWWAAWASVAGKLRDYPELESALDVLVERWPDWGPATDGPPIQAMLAQGRREEAAAYLETVDWSEKKGRDERVWALRMLGRDEEFGQRVDDWLAEMETDRDRAKLVGSYGWKELEHRADVPAARARFEQAAALDPGKELDWIQNGLGWTALLQDDREQARTVFEEVVERGEGGSNPHLGLAALDLLEGRPAEAEQRLAERQETAPVASHSLRWLALTRAEQGRWEEAVGPARQATGMNPSAENFTQLAWILVAGDLDVEEGLILARRAIENRSPWYPEIYARFPFTPSAEHTVGLALVKRGEVREGIAMLEEASQLRPDRPRIREDLQRASSLL